MAPELADYYDRKDPRYGPRPGERRDHPLIGLVHPGDGPLQDRESLAADGITFAGDCFALARLQLIVVDAFAFITSQSRQALAEDQLAVAFVTLGQQVLQAGAFLFEIQREIVLLVSAGTPEQAAAVQQDTLEQLQNLAEDLAGIRLFLTFSDPGQGLGSIAGSYEICNMLQQWRVLHMDVTPALGPTALDARQEIREQGPERRDILREKEALRLFKGGQYRGARDIVRQLFAEDYLALAEPLVLLKHKCSQYLTALAAAGMELCGEALLPLLDEYQTERHLLAARSYPEVQALMEHSFGHINDLTLKLRSGGDRSWVLDVQDYVRANFADPNLNVNTIADHFEKNAAWLSRCFLRQTGDSLLEYIHRYRIQEAKIRIGRGDSLADTAEAVGYGSLITMSRAFKKYEGTTPGKLR